MKKSTLFYKLLQNRGLHKTMFGNLVANTLVGRSAIDRRAYPDLNA